MADMYLQFQRMSLRGSLLSYATRRRRHMSFSRRQHTPHQTPFPHPFQVSRHHSSVVHQDAPADGKSGGIGWNLNPPPHSSVAGRMIEGNTTFGRRVEGLRGLGHDVIRLIFAFERIVRIVSTCRARRVADIERAGCEANMMRIYAKRGPSGCRERERAKNAFVLVLISKLFALLLVDIRCLAFTLFCCRFRLNFGAT